MDYFRIEYNLHKDGSWVSDGFDTREEAEEAFNRLKADGYNPRKEKMIETPINKGVFNMGGCSAFAEVFYERFKNEIPSIKLGVVRGKIKLDDYEEYGDTEWEDCHAVVMLNEEYYFDADGLVKFNPESKIFGFSNDTLKVELIALDDKDYKRDDYFIYSEYDGDMGYPLLEKSIHATFGLINDGGTLNLEEINNYKEKANKYIDENTTFFNSEIKKAVQVQNEDLAKLRIKMSISRKELLEELLVPFKEKYETGNYIIVSGNHIIKKPFWERFDLTEKLIHKKDIKILEEFIKDKNTKIEWFVSHNGYPYIWDDFCLDFIKDYDEDYQYRLKNMQ